MGLNLWKKKALLLYDLVVWLLESVEEHTAVSPPSLCQAWLILRDSSRCRCETGNRQEMMSPSGGPKGSDIIVALGQQPLLSLLLLPLPLSPHHTSCTRPTVRASLNQRKAPPLHVRSNHYALFTFNLVLIWHLQYYAMWTVCTGAMT